LHALDRDMIMDIYSAASSVPVESNMICHPFAVKNDGYVIVVNRSLVIEWPLELVDTADPTYKKLLRAARLSNELARKLQNTAWGQVFIQDKASIFDCEEIEPMSPDTFSYRIDTGHVFHFNRHYRALLDKIWPPYIINDVPTSSMEVRIHVRFEELLPSVAPARLLIIANGRRRGLLACSGI
jgi:hypothetical protein